MAIEEVLLQIKTEMEQAITSATFNGEKKANGLEAKKALICSSRVVNHLHEHIKEELIKHGVGRDKVFPPLGRTKPELKLAGYLKQKNQDICVKPSHIEMKKEKIHWGPLSYEEKWDAYGQELTEQILSINIRSQLSSVAKNSDTIFERTFAESSNFHELYRKMVLGEVCLIPVYEYCDEAMKRNEIGWKEPQTNLEKYISFFSEINGRKKIQDSNLKYERCALLIVDFRSSVPKLYNRTEELKEDGLVREGFSVEIEPISLKTFVPDLLHTYKRRFDLSNLVTLSPKKKMKRQQFLMKSRQMSIFDF